MSCLDRVRDTRTTMASYALATLLTLVPQLLAGVEGPRPPLRFEQNNGQTDRNILYLSRGARQRVFLTRDGATLHVLGAETDAALRIRPVGSSREARVAGEGRREAVSRYVGPRGAVEAPQFERVRYDSIYPGVDWVFYGTDDGRLEHDFVVGPGADPERIRLEIAGADVRVAEDGALVLTTPAGELELLPPVAYQEIGGERRSVDARFAADGGVVAFALGEYDRSRELVIDPVLSYARYLGGAGAETAASIRVADDGSAFIVGATRSLNFPVSAGAGQTTFSGGQCAGSLVARPCFDVFAAKLTADGSDIAWAAYLGGTGEDLAVDAALDGAGGLILAGTTDSADFPATAGALRTTRTGEGLDAFAARFDASGSLVYATLLGGSGVDQAAGVAADAEGAAYIAGHTKSLDFPTTAGVIAGVNPSDADRTAVFAAKLAPDGGSLVYGTYLGGSLDDRAGDIAVNAAGEAFVTGSTGSPDFPTAPNGNPFGGGPRAFQAERNGLEADAFVARLTANGAGLLYSTYFGGSDSDAGKRIAVLGDDSAILIGSTDSRDLYTTQGALLPVWKRSLGFAARINSGGSGFAYSTYLVGGADALAVDAEGAAYVAGAAGADSPFGGAVVPACNGSLLRKISPDGRRLLYSGFFRGLGAIDVAADGFLYSAGSDASGVLETTGGLASAGQTDVYAAKVGLDAETGVSLTCVEHGASFFPGEAAPGQIIALFGSGLGPMQPAGPAVENGVVTNESAGVRVLFDGVPAPLLFVWWNQLNVVVPYSVDGKSMVEVRVERDGESSPAFPMPVAAAHPGLFTRDSTGSGLGALLNENGSINTAQNPAAAGSIVSFYGTGEGQTSPAGVDGLVTPETSGGLPAPKLPVTVEIGSETAEVLYAGAAPGFVSGVLQINARIPAGTPPGPAPVRVTIGGRFNRQPVFVEVE